MVIVTLCLLMPACTGLIVRDDDTASAKVGKITARVFLIAPTAGMSEQIISDLKAQERYEAWRVRRGPQEASVSDRQSYVEDQKQAVLSESIPNWLVSLFAGDILGLCIQTASLLAGWFSADQGVEEAPLYLPPPPIPRLDTPINRCPMVFTCTPPPDPLRPRPAFSTNNR